LLRKNKKKVAKKFLVGWTKGGTRKGVRVATILRGKKNQVTRENLKGVNGVLPELKRHRKKKVRGRGASDSSGYNGEKELKSRLIPN